MIASHVMKMLIEHFRLFKEPEVNVNVNKVTMRLYSNQMNAYTHARLHN